MSSASDAAAKIRDRVGLGILPRDKPESIYAGYGPVMAGATVDIVDDDPAMAEALQLVLEAHGFRAQVFGSGEAFLESKPRDRQTACLLVDVHLTGMSGFDLTDRLRTLGLSIPTVFMTGLDDGPTCQRARNAGAVAYLRKPFDNDVLITALRWAGDVLDG